MAQTPRVLVDLDRCTGCMQCMLACSLETTGGYNPRHAKLAVEQELIGNPTGIQFLEACDVKHEDQCRLQDGAPPCVKSCLPSALKFPGYTAPNVFPDLDALRAMKKDDVGADLVPAPGATTRVAPTTWPGQPQGVALTTSKYPMSGYMGKILRVNLTNRSVRVEELPPELCKTLLGGNGIGAWFLFHEVPARIDAFSPDNKLIFATGPLNGTQIPMAAKFCVVGKSPLTGGYMDSISSSLFGTELKYAGYDVLILEGESEKPVTIWIDDDRVEFRDARDLWGTDCFTAQHRIKAECGDPRVRVLVIGPGGENRVRYASVLGEHRALGTGGIGAVLGAKRVKGLACRGTHLLKVQNPGAVWKFVEKLMTLIPKSRPAQVLTSFGTAVHTMVLDAIGGLPTRNFSTGKLKNPEGLSGERMRERFTQKTLGCISCMTPCGMYTRVSSGPYAGSFTLGPEFQAIGSLGSNWGHNELGAVIHADYLSDYYGIGQVSAGNCIAWTMECVERGILSPKDLDGLDLGFGNHEAAMEMMRKIALREGFGSILAEGVKRAAEVVGKGSIDFANHIKGMEVSGFEPRTLQSQAIGFSISNRGPIHNEVRPLSEFFGNMDWSKIEKNGQNAKEMSDWTGVANCLVWCLSAERVLDFRLSPIVAEMLNAVTQWGWEVGDLVLVGERVQALERAFNVREGFSRKDDRLPRRMMKEILPEGASRGKVVPPEVLDIVLDGYYDARGWDRQGVPTRQTLARLGLQKVADELEPQRPAGTA